MQVNKLITVNVVWLQEDPWVEWEQHEAIHWRATPTTVRANTPVWCTAQVSPGTVRQVEPWDGSGQLLIFILFHESKRTRWMTTTWNMSVFSQSFVFITRTRWREPLQVTTMQWHQEQLMTKMEEGKGALNLWSVQLLHRLTLKQLMRSMATGLDRFCIQQNIAYLANMQSPVHCCVS